MSSWTKQRIKQWLAETEFNEYQGIDLPFGLRVPGPDRSPTVDVAFKGLPLNDSTHVLVVGSHYGAVPNILAERGAGLVIGMEARPKYQAIAEKIIEIKGLTGKVSFVGGNCERDPLPGGMFDYVTLFNVNHHFKYPVSSLARVASKATKAFLLEWATFKTYNERHGDDQVDPDLMELYGICLSDKYGCWYMSKRAIEAALREIGFKKFTYTEGTKASTRSIAQCLR